MTLALFKYGLPLLLGYTLFVGVSGRLTPFVLPHYRQERASWYLGIWIGMAVSGVLIVGLHLAYDMPSSYAYSLLVPSASVLACLITPALAFFVVHSYQIKKPVRELPATSFDWVMSDEQLQLDTATEPEDDTTPPHTRTENSRPALTASWNVSPAYLEALRIDQVSSDIDRDAVNDSGPLNDSTLKNRHESTIQSGDEQDSRLIKEIALREETEKHLRITRKALSVLEADTRHHSMDKADALIDLEEKLAQSIDSAAALEAVAAQEKVKRIEAEDCIVELKQKMVQAKQEIRRGAAARAKALSTANKSIAFARQSVQIRARLESQLSEVQATVDTNQKTMSSLVRALEKEKRKTQQEIASAARQLVLNDKQLKAKRSLEQVARSVENKLTSRLVKKVARARPLSTGLNTDLRQGEAE